MSDLEQLMKERMTDDDAKKVAKLLTVLADVMGDEAEQIKSGLRENMDNLIHNATKIKEALGDG